ncbi:hypothetical protein PP175_22315 [Aneurinibacillus sp. Ricciae_BoGa-3]|uniref:hypothetical protein n=1 Tax=Aneurinibacillus sp. Ricciae_BoGa-3 TaxID=3022697 RepID=UPI002340B4B4|nr:hypothetical protein [Aneurinibacillus sp. Ricciae_BoGa-3]WCK54020.1 hypothetical protein PP175_22315 [Aneurinibacillus sp. Ricciae_BoGa-3]
MNPGDDYRQIYVMHGHHFMREYHAMEGFHFIGTAVTLLFWLAAVVLVVAWLQKRRRNQSVSQSLMELPVTYHTVTRDEVDFLDEWEKRQTKHKEEP